MILFDSVLLVFVHLVIPFKENDITVYKIKRTRASTMAQGFHLFDNRVRYWVLCVCSLFDLLSHHETHMFVCSLLLPGFIWSVPHVHPHSCQTKPCNFLEIQLMTQEFSKGEKVVDTLLISLGMHRTINDGKIGTRLRRHLNSPSMQTVPSWKPPWPYRSIIRAIPVSLPL